MEENKKKIMEEIKEEELEKVSGGAIMRLGVYCPHCKELVGPGDWICPYCGQPIK